MTIATIPNHRIAYVRHIGPYGLESQAAMQQLKQWAENNQLLVESAILFGIPQDNPQTTLPENCRYDACIVIPDDFQVDSPVSEGVISGGKYAVYTIEHTAEAIQRAWDEIFTDLHKHGYQMDHKPIFERYKGQLVLNDYCEIGVPIK
nr:GyrI-like domain-containing protein [Paenibacillus sp. NEAU-GSW1]